MRTGGAEGKGRISPVLRLKERRQDAKEKPKKQLPIPFGRGWSPEPPPAAVSVFFLARLQDASFPSSGREIPAPRSLCYV